MINPITELRKNIDLFEYKDPIRSSNNQPDDETMNVSENINDIVNYMDNHPELFTEEYIVLSLKKMSKQ